MVGAIEGLYGQGIGCALQRIELLDRALGVIGGIGPVTGGIDSQ